MHDLASTISKCKEDDSGLNKIPIVRERERERETETEGAKRLNHEKGLTNRKKTDSSVNQTEFQKRVKGDQITEKSTKIQKHKNGLPVNDLLNTVKLKPVKYCLQK